MATFPRAMIRIVAVGVACVLSSAQFPYFDCNKMPALSIASGVVTLLLVYATGEAIYSVIGSARSALEKVVIGACVVLGGTGLVAAAGFFLLITHLCP